MARKTDPVRQMSDIIPTTSPALSEALAELGDRSRVRMYAGMEDAVVADPPVPPTIRKSLVEGDDSDPNGFERIIGESDLTSINFLDRGKRAAAAVCRIRLPVAGGMAYGTGFVVGQRLLLTNNHVLSNESEASQADLEFGYEHDIDGVLAEPVRFNLRPEELFFTSVGADFTFVAIAPLSDNGTPIDRFGRVPLLPLSGKAVDGEWVTIIQHPNGDPKQIAIRASQIAILDQAQVPSIDLERFIHYTTDTEPGSSGSPVLNDQWQVVALHHKGVPSPQPAPDGSIVWIANEGIRVSAIYERLEHSRFEKGDAGEVLNRLSGALGLDPIVPLEVLQTEQYAPLPVATWKAAKFGYDTKFLSLPIDLDVICANARKAKLTAPLLTGKGDELKYQHFSVVMNKERRFALLTAVNIDGKKLIHPGKRVDTWRPDARISEKYQADDEFYVKTRAEEKVYFSRGHLVRLLDPCWGTAVADSQRGMEHSFHFTNAAPQFQTYNDADWGNLEDYLLDRAQTTEQKLTVFTGPIYRKDDPLYGKTRKGGPWQIPLSYWKIAVLQKSPTRVGAAAFIVGQTEYVKALYEAKVFSGLKPYTVDDMRSRHIQTTIQTIEAETGLDFSMLREFDVQGSLEATRKTRWINRPGDVQI